MSHIFNYFAKYALHGEKKKSYNLFLEIHARFLKKDHLDIEIRKEMTDLAALVNPMSKGRSRKKLCRPLFFKKS